MIHISPLFCDSLLPWDCTVRPARFVAKECGNVAAYVVDIFRNAHFLVKNGAAIPAEKTMTVLNLVEAQKLSIPADGGKSPLFVFRHDQFSVERDEGGSSLRVVRRRDAGFENISFHHIFLTGALSRVAWSVSSLGKATLGALPALALGAVGVPVRAVCVALGSLTSQRDLRVCCVEKESYAAIAGEAKNWQLLAQKKHKSLVASVEVQEEEAERMDASAKICKGISLLLEKEKEGTEFYENVFICCDVALKRIQGIMLVKQSLVVSARRGALGTHFVVTSLATHPDNIQSRINDKVYTKVRGAGTALITALAKECLLKGFSGIYLEAVSSSTSFYSHLGFEQLPSDEITCPRRVDIPMLMTKEKIKMLLAKERRYH